MDLENQPWWNELIALKDTTPLKELAAKFDVSVGQISAALKRTNTARVPQGGEAPPGPAGVEAPASEAARPGSKDALIEAHLGLLGKIPDSEVAEKAGVSVRTIAAYRSRNGIPGYQGRSLTKKRRQRKSKIDPYQDLLGKVPDRVVAEQAGVTLNAVRNYRSNRGIQASRGRGTPLQPTEAAAPAPAPRAAAPVAAPSSPPALPTPAPPPVVAPPPRSAATGMIAWLIRFEADQVAVVSAADLVDAARRAESSGRGDVRAIERLGSFLG